MRRSFRWLGLLGLAALGVWLAWPAAHLEAPPKSVGVPRASAVASQAAGPEGPRHSIWALAARATAVADEATGARLSPDWDASEAGRQESAAWCRQGQAAHAQFEAAAGAGASAPAPAAVDLSNAELLAARNRAWRRWAAHLGGQSSARARAAADYLLAGQGDAGQAARQRLIAAGRVASDPMVVALALQRCGAAAECSRSLGLRWAQLDPPNFQAWLHASPNLPADEMLRGAAQGRESRAYQRELVQLLIDSPQAPAAGLRDSAEAMLLIEIEAAWQLPPWQALINQCRQVDLAAAQRQQCLAIADGVWRTADDSLIDKVLAVRMAVNQGADRDPVWRRRATHTEAALQWLEADMAPHLLRGLDLAQCDRAASLGIREDLRQGEAARVADALQRAGVDVEALAAQRRLKARRSLLAPLPPQPPASR